VRTTLKKTNIIQIIGLPFSTLSNNNVTYRQARNTNYNVLRIMSGMGGLAYSN
jgi:hypothetical protein